MPELQPRSHLSWPRLPVLQPRSHFELAPAAEPALVPAPRAAIRQTQRGESDSEEEEGNGRRRRRVSAPLDVLCCGCRVAVWLAAAAVACCSCTCRCAGCRQGAQSPMTMLRILCRSCSEPSLPWGTRWRRPRAGCAAAALQQLSKSEWCGWRGASDWFALFAVYGMEPACLPVCKLLGESAAGEETRPPHHAVSCCPGTWGS